MNKWTLATVEELMAAIPKGGKRPRTAIETGTFRGDCAINLSPAFEKWHTIDIEPKYTLLAERRLKEAGRANVKCHVGDSRVILPRILSTTLQPVCVFLDAHFSRVKRKKFADEPDMVHRPGADFPLWGEIDFLSGCPHELVVVVDDWVLAGTEPKGCRATGDESQQWASLSVDEVSRRLGKVSKSMSLVGTMVFYRPWNGG
jgi:hypothetical protein